MIPKTIIHLDSGGMDSTTLKYQLHSEGHKLHCLLIDYGQKHVQELEFAKLHCRRLGLLYTTITLPQLKGSSLTDGPGSVVVPGRNLIFLSLALNLAIAAGADTITYGCNKEDEIVFPDCRMAFVQGLNLLLGVMETPVSVWTPYIDKSKWWIAGMARELGVPLNETWSCYEGGKEPCGKCEACRKREAALK